MPLRGRSASASSSSAACCCSPSRSSSSATGGCSSRTASSCTASSATPSGLQVGPTVRVAGMDAGEVKDIEIPPRAVGPVPRAARGARGPAPARPHRLGGHHPDRGPGGRAVRADQRRVGGRAARRRGRDAAEPRAVRHCRPAAADERDRQRSSTTTILVLRDDIEAAIAAVQQTASDADTLLTRRGGRRQRRSPTAGGADSRTTRRNCRRACGQGQGTVGQALRRRPAIPRGHVTDRRGAGDGGEPAAAVGAGARRHRGGRRAERRGQRACGQLADHAREHADGDDEPGGGHRGDEAQLPAPRLLQTPGLLHPADLSPIDYRQGVLEAKAAAPCASGCGPTCCSTRDRRALAV